jgi:hypothetical protein
MEVTEGPVSWPMEEAFDRFKAEGTAADARYQENITPALEAFEDAL